MVQGGGTQWFHFFYDKQNSFLSTSPDRIFARGNKFLNGVLSVFVFSVILVGDEIRSEKFFVSHFAIATVPYSLWEFCRIISSFI